MEVRRGRAFLDVTDFYLVFQQQLSSTLLHRELNSSLSPRIHSYRKVEIDAANSWKLPQSQAQDTPREKKLHFLGNLHVFCPGKRLASRGTFSSSPSPSSTWQLGFPPSVLERSLIYLFLFHRQKPKASSSYAILSPLCAWGKKDNGREKNFVGRDGCR